MLDEYYQLHGWDISTGWQRYTQLEQLDLKDIAADLDQAGRLAANTDEE